MEKSIRLICEANGHDVIESENGCYDAGLFILVGGTDSFDSWSQFHKCFTVTLLLSQGNLSVLSTVSQSPREVLNICRCMSSLPSPVTGREIFQNNRSSAAHESALDGKRRQHRLEESWKQLSMM